MTAPSTHANARAHATGTGTADKEQAAGPKPLSQKEAHDLRGRLIDLLGGIFDDTDRLLTTASATKKEAAIWSTIDDQEIALLADTWIEWGRRSARGAAVVRTVIRQWRKYQVALILGPRFLETINFVAENGVAVPTPAWRKSRRTTAQPASAKPAPPRAVPVMVDAAPSEGVSVTGQQSSPATAASAPPAEPAPDSYAAAEARQREHAARVLANRTLAAEAQKGAAVDVPSA